MKILSFAGSLRRDSTNKKLAREAVRVLDRHFLVRTDYADLRDHPMPIYDGDTERNEGIPSAVIKLGKKIAEADALIIDTIDWVSRLKPMPLAGKHLLLLSASAGR